MLWSIPDWSFLHWGALLVGGVACGFINTLAGGGSFITITLLLYLGQTPHVANATNRLALVIQTSTAAAGFWVAGVKDLRTVLWLAGPGLLGSLLGALVAVALEPEVFRTVFAVLLLLAVIPAISRPDAFEERPPKESFERPSPLLMLAFFFVGVYSGFLQIGVGVWSLLLLLLLGEFQVNHANAIKSQLLCLTTLIATVIFLYNDQVVLSVGLTLALGNAVGAWLATWLVRDQKVSWLRWFVLACALAACLRLLKIV